MGGCGEEGHMEGKQTVVILGAVLTIILGKNCMYYYKRDNFQLI